MKLHAAPLVRLNLFQLPLNEVVAHEGQGKIRFARVASRHAAEESGASRSLSGACNYIDYSVMPPGTMVGLHTHAENEEEFYLILRGCW